MSRISINSRARLRRALARGVSAAVLALWAGPALAQEEPTRRRARPTEERRRRRRSSSPARASRTDGMQAPVPLTVVSADEVEALSPGALISGVSPAAAVLRQPDAQFGRLLHPRGLRRAQHARARRQPHADAAQRPPHALDQRLRRRRHQPVSRSHAALGRNHHRRRFGGLRFGRRRRRRQLHPRHQVHRARGERAGRHHRPRRRRQLRALGRLRHAVRGRARACPASRASITTRRASTATTGRDWYQGWGTFGVGSAGQPVQLRAEHRSRTTPRSTA